MEITDFPIDILEQITPMDIEEYLQYLKFYTHNGKEYTNDERGQMRKLACLRSFYNYFFRKEIIEKILLHLCRCLSSMKKYRSTGCG